MSDSSLNDGVVRTALLSMLGNTLLAVFKGTAGFFGNSYALIADAIESTTDVFSSLLLVIGLWFSRRPADENHPYGHGRAESLATFIVVAFLLTSATVITIESIRHIISPHKTPAPYTLIVLLVVIVIKEGFFRWFQRRGEETGSSALKAEAWHHRSDAITSVAAFFGITVALIMGPGWESADDWAALIAAGIIYYNAWRIFRPTLGEMMDEDLHDDVRQQVIAVIAQNHEIQAVSLCLIRKMGSHYLIDLNLQVDGQLTVAQSCQINQSLRKAIKTQNPFIHRVLIQLDCKSCAQSVL